MVETLTPLTSAEVAEYIGIREFMQLCEFADRTYGQRIYGGAQRGAWGMKQDLFFVGDRIEGVRFEVLMVKVTGPKKKEVLLRVGKVTTHLFWDNVKYMEKKAAPAQKENVAG